MVMLPAVVPALAAGGCATGKEVSTPRYTLNMPELWQVKAEGQVDGQPTTVVIGGQGQAAAGQTEIEVRVYAWPEPAGGQNPTQQAAAMLASDPILQLSRHLLTPEQPPECNFFKRQYRLLGVDREPLDLLSRPGWRTIVVGG